MMRALLCFFQALAVVLIACVVSLVSWAQITSVTDQTSTPIPGVGHDYIELGSETVNPANGSVSIHIPVPAAPGRQLTMPFSFAYNSNGVHYPVGGSNGYAYWGSNAGYMSSGGWAYAVPKLNYTHGLYEPYIKFACPYTTGYVFQDPSGTPHSLGLADFRSNPHCTPLGTSKANDSLYQATISGGTYITDASGTVYTFYNANCGTWANDSALLVSIEDRNGNKISGTGPPGSCAFTYTDTMNRPVISISGFGSSGDTVTVPGQNPYSLSWGSVSSNSGMYLQPIGTPNPHCTGIGWEGETDSVISQIKLPNGQSYQFYYDSTLAVLNKIVYPGGGYVTYSWALNPLSEAASFADDLGNPNRCLYTYGTYVVAHRYVSFDGSTTALQQDFSYSTTWSTTSPGEWDTKATTVTTHDLIAGTVSSTDYTYSGRSQASPPWIYERFASQIPVEQSVVYKDGNGSVLETVNKGWYNPFEFYGQQTTLGSVTSQVIYTYGPGGAVTEKDEYDFGQSTPSRKTVLSYQSFAATPIYNFSPSIYNKPCKMVVYDGGGNAAKETDYFYDGTTSTTPCATATTQALPGSGSFTAHDETNYGTTATVPRGNLTKKIEKQCLSQSCSGAVTTYTYDETGQVLTMTDPCGNTPCSDMTGTAHTTTYSYADNFTRLSGGQNVPFTPGGNTNAYLTSVTNPLGQTSRYTYDFDGGQLTASKDPNLQTTSYLYNDALSRLSSISAPDGGQTTLAHNDAPYNAAAPSPSLTSTTVIASGLNRVSTTAFDGLGHAVKNILSSDPDGHTYTVTKYDGFGRPYQAYNPTRCATPTTNCGESTWGYSTYNYDALGRTLSVTQPDGSSVASSYTDNCSTMMDEAQKSRKSCSDGLHRLTKVFEDPSGLNYETDYQYDANDNLLNVTQKGGASAGNWRNRSFVYDSLSRLLSATNPESGTIAYTYDANGNVATKIAPKPGSANTSTATITTNYSYDVLSRLTNKDYVNIRTANAQYGYDGVALTGCTKSPPSITSPSNLIGRRSAMCAGKSGSSWSYDPVSRPLVESRLNAGSANTTYNIGYSYNLDGSLKTLTYPSGDVLTYTPGGAGRTTQLSDAGNNYVGYSGNFATYAPTGSLASSTNGHTATVAGIATANSYNNRLQPAVLSAATPSNTLFSLSYDFHSGNGNNGNVFQVIDNADSTRSAAYIYDPLNRIQQAHSIATTGGQCWGESYAIDAWGNLTNRAGVSGMTGCNTESLSATANPQNQLSILTYDAAGNVKDDGSGNQPTYDGENRIATDAGVSYNYDADGMRIEKSSGTMYWPGSSGEVLTETNLAGAINEEYIYFNGGRIARVDRPSGAVHYYFLDHLGSTSFISDASGNVQRRDYYYPYGGTQSSVGSDLNHYKFTGKERDAESGLDNFGFRYFGSSIGRFMSPDDDSAQDQSNPQSWNLYSYVINKPTTATDPDGHDCIYVASGSGEMTGFSRGDCENSPNAKANSGIYVDGTINSISFDNSSGSLNYSYTGEDGSLGVGTILGVTQPQLAPMDHGAVTPGMLGPVGDMILFSAVKMPSFVTDTVGKLFGSILGKGAEEAVGAGVDEILAKASSSVGNQGAKVASREVAEQAAKEWVGEGSRPITDRLTGKVVGEISADGTKVARFTSAETKGYINLVNRLTGGNLHVGW